VIRDAHRGSGTAYAGTLGVMTRNSSPAVALAGLVKTFHARSARPVHAVTGLDLVIEPGEVVALLGPNGAGKTTTLDMMLGLTRPTSGSAAVFGGDPRAAVTAGRVSAVLQTGGLLRDLTVRETVTMLRSTFTDARPVEEVLDRAGLRQIANRKVAKCSGGEQQRLRFALALLPDPDLLVLDEPTAGMDVTARRDFWNTMHADADAGRTVVFATHYLEEADAFAQRIVLVAGGRVVADGSTAEIRARATGRTVSADVPPEGPDTIVPALRALPGVVDVDVIGTRITVRATDSDRVARALLVDLGGTNVEIASGSLESAFLAITGDPSATAAHAVPTRELQEAGR
jgi:ABC-2 type transport system ATP-binding protein